LAELCQANEACKKCLAEKAMKIEGKAGDPDGSGQQMKQGNHFKTSRTSYAK